MVALFEPIQIGANRLQHRVVLAPLTRLRADENHVIPPDLAIEYYSQRATPGGLLISEGILISEDAGGFPGTPAIYTEEQISAWSKVTQAVHAKGGTIFAQIWHSGRAGTALYTKNHTPPVAPSPIPARGLNVFLNNQPFETPRELSIDEIQDVIQEFVTAAKNAIKAGFDGVELHGANGFLLDQFINSQSNKRTDEYGGSIKNRTRLIFEVADALIDAIGVERTAYRFSPWGGNADVKDDTPYQTWSYILEHLNPKLAYVHFVEPRDDYVRATPDFENSLDPFRKIWKGPFISAGGYSTNPELISSVAEEKPRNLIAVGRAFIANPDLVERLKHQWPLNKYNRDTFYTPGAKGYTDYAFYEPKD
ncbi:hypothetical protein BDA99DRAFT_436889 [Phascolomyces articulosus]|uniref:NADH:flavin oxidoreductase/NADH oxidase N-terminal domain-containing protein n=1 Tax=Phascolomyces articulosus TaxID=60185 RepID=A0AAD5PGJ2_9FUNG|nr:hypothetical protein BDA99DRAFT_436889 [Phascolomyces articulosus]